MTIYSFPTSSWVRCSKKFSSSTILSIVSSNILSLNSRYLLRSESWRLVLGREKAFNEEDLRNLKITFTLVNLWTLEKTQIQTQVVTGQESAEELIVMTYTCINRSAL